MTDEGPPITEPSAAPEFFADGFTTLCVQNGVARLTFYTLAHTSVDESERRIVARLVMPAFALFGLSQASSEMIGRLQDQQEARPN